KRWVKISVAVTGIAVGVGFFAVGLGDSKSFFQRLDIWAQLLGNDSALLGHGIGYVGAASGAAGSAIQIFTDNYYISLWLQFGIPAIASIGILIAVLVMLFREGKRGNSRAALAASLWAGLLVAFFLVEFWEYTSSMCLVAVVIGASARGYVRSRPDGQHIVAHTAPLDLSQPVMTAPTRSQK
ncbi:MAG: hypothetical protein JWQ43_4128, partial [Glaciihabitans sp.]|nr:hypothetical protein [Glaciihabitans sp.]